MDNRQGAPVRGWPAECAGVPLHRQGRFAQYSTDPGSSEHERSSAPSAGPRRFVSLLSRGAAGELGLEPGLLAGWTAVVTGSTAGLTAVEPAGPGVPGCSLAGVRRLTLAPPGATFVPRGRWAQVPGIRYALMANGVPVVTAPAGISVTTAGQAGTVLVHMGGHGHG